MNGITSKQSVQAETQEARMMQNGSYKMSALTVLDGKVYLGDGRQGLSESDVMVHLPAWNQKQIYGASGENDKIDGLNIYGDKWFGMYGDYDKITKILAQYPYMTASDIAGAAGEEALTHYETIRKTAQTSNDVSGLERILEELNAFNIAKKETTSGFKHEYIKKTSAVLTADVELADDVMPGDIRPAFAIGDKEIFADGTSYKTNLRDKELKLNVAAEIAKGVPGMFAQTKENKAIALVNALSSTNQGDWDAVTGNFYDVRAAEQVDVGVAAVKAYGGPIHCLLNSDTWRLYMDNLGSAFDGKAGNKTTEVASALTGTLAGNPNVKYWINDSITSQSYILASVNSYMKYIQGMKIKTSFKDVRTAGQTETTFEFDFNGFFENEIGAAFHGATVGA